MNDSSANHIIKIQICLIEKKTVGPANKSKEKKKSHRKVTRLVLTVVTVYVLCWLPYWVSQVIPFTKLLPLRNQLLTMCSSTYQGVPDFHSAQIISVRLHGSCLPAGRLFGLLQLGRQSHPLRFPLRQL